MLATVDQARSFSLLIDESRVCCLAPRDAAVTFARASAVYRARSLLVVRKRQRAAHARFPNRGSITSTKRGDHALCALSVSRENERVVGGGGDRRAVAPFHEKAAARRRVVPELNGAHKRIHRVMNGASSRRRVNAPENCAEHEAACVWMGRQGFDGSALGDASTPTPRETGFLRQSTGMSARYWTILAFLGGALIAVVLVAASQIIPEKPPEVWSEVAKAGVQIGLVGLVASGVTYVLGLATAARDNARRIEAYRLRIFGELVEAYNGVKAVRRTLRALGFRITNAGDPALARPLPRHRCVAAARARQALSACYRAGGGTNRLTANQADQFLAEMRSLVRNQLALESIKRELDVRVKAFPEEEFLQTRVNTVEKHLGRLITQWENNGPTIVQGADFKVARDLTLLQDFLGDKTISFDPAVAEPMAQVQDWLRQHVDAG